MGAMRPVHGSWDWGFIKLLGLGARPRSAPLGLFGGEVLEVDELVDLAGAGGEVWLRSLGFVLCRGFAWSGPRSVPWGSGCASSPAAAEAIDDEVLLEHLFGEAEGQQLGLRAADGAFGEVEGVVIVFNSSANSVSRVSCETIQKHLGGGGDYGVGLGGRGPLGEALESLAKPCKAGAVGVGHEEKIDDRRAGNGHGAGLREGAKGRPDGLGRGKGLMLLGFWHGKGFLVKDMMRT